MIQNRVDTAEIAEECFKEYMKSGLYSAIAYQEDDELLEHFFEYIDMLEEKATQDVTYYMLLSDCYEQLGDLKSAIEAFNHYFDPNDKKHLKRMYELQHLKMKKVTRPSKRSANIPMFKYVSKKICKEMFEVGESCSICEKRKVPLYIGMAYETEENLISFAERSDRFCAKCIKEGRAAENKRIAFNSPYILGNKRMKKQATELVYRTPGVDSEECINKFCEDGWMICCDDFCVLDRSKDGNYFFKCKKCKKIYEILD